MFPDGTPLRVIVTPGQLSLAVAVPSVASDTNAPQEVAPRPVETLRAGGAASEGGVLSTTVTAWVALDVLPEASVAV
jgi:hypothetical protein